MAQPGYPADKPPPYNPGMAPQQGYPPAQGYPPPAQGYPPQAQGYPAQPGYPPAQPGYPPQPGYAPQGGYPPQQNMMATNTVVVAAAQPTVQTSTVVVQRQQPRVNHVLHAIITFFFWPWIIVWIILCIVEGA